MNFLLDMYLPLLSSPDHVDGLLLLNWFYTMKRDLLDIPRNFLSWSRASYFTIREDRALHDVVAKSTLDGFVRRKPGPFDTD